MPITGNDIEFIDAECIVVECIDVECIDIKWHWCQTHLFWVHLVLIECICLEHICAKVTRWVYGCLVHWLWVHWVWVHWCSVQCDWEKIWCSDLAFRRRQKLQFMIMIVWCNAVDQCKPFCMILWCLLNFLNYEIENYVPLVRQCNRSSTGNSCQQFLLNKWRNDGM